VTRSGSRAMMPAVTDREPSGAYDLFILVLTILSLLLMVGLLLPVSEATKDLLVIYDNLICVVFLVDFTIRLRRAPSKRGYLIGENGWLDLLGSIPSFGFFTYTSVLRLARLSRFARITRLLRGRGKHELARDVLENRGRYAAFVTLLAAFLVLVVASILVLQFESKAADANIHTGGEALWWAVVTITTVGYGDLFPVTAAGRVTAFLVMMAGVGIIGALASILASVLLPSNEDDAVATASVERELAALRAEIAGLREDVRAGTDRPG
jgi:voltage-gated potassium channel